jgi:hypothetical protein
LKVFAAILAISEKDMSTSCTVYQNMSEDQRNVLRAIFILTELFDESRNPWMDSYKNLNKWLKACLADKEITKLKTVIRQPIT